MNKRKSTCNFHWLVNSDAVSPSFRKMTVSRILPANVESTIELTVHTA